MLIFFISRQFTQIHSTSFDSRLFIVILFTYSNLYCCIKDTVCAPCALLFTWQDQEGQLKCKECQKCPVTKVATSQCTLTQDRVCVDCTPNCLKCTSDTKCTLCDIVSCQKKWIALLYRQHLTSIFDNF